MRSKRTSCSALPTKAARGICRVPCTACASSSLNEMPSSVDPVEPEQMPCLVNGAWWRKRRLRPCLPVLEWGGATTQHQVGERSLLVIESSDKFHQSQRLSVQLGAPIVAAERYARAEQSLTSMNIFLLCRGRNVQLHTKWLYNPSRSRINENLSPTVCGQRA